MILGIDEVGRGPWAGPLVVGAVLLDDNAIIDGLTDSKKVSAKKRKLLDERIRSEAVAWGLGWVHPDELDAIGLSAALRVATIRAVEAITAPYHEIIIDGTINFLSNTTKGNYVTTMPKADLLVPSVSAASIIAKVARDTYMAEQNALYPEYGFSSHVGYGTALHKAAILKYGITELHRKSFAPIKKVLGEKQKEHTKSISSNKVKGDIAEDKTELLLRHQGFTIVARNWKTKFCEIDIVAEKDSTRYFIEVKYRSSTAQGGGIAAITSKKLQQMRFAAELYDTRFPHDNDSRLAVVAVNQKGKMRLFEV